MNDETDMKGQGSNVGRSCILHQKLKIFYAIWQWIYRFYSVVDYFDDAFIPFWLPIFFSSTFCNYSYVPFSLCFFRLFFFSSTFPSLISYPLFCLGARYTDAISTEMHTYLCSRKTNPQSTICECVWHKA